MAMRPGASCLRPSKIAIIDARMALEIRIMTKTVHCVIKGKAVSSSKNDGKAPSDEFYYAVQCFNREDTKSAKDFLIKGEKTF